jgi:transposase-like protein
MATNNLSAPQFHDPESARTYLESIVWPHGRVCPHCGSIGEHYALRGKSQRAGLYKCKDCREQFTVTVGTLFEGSKIPLNKWLMAAYLMASSKKGISAHQLHRTLGITYKSAWFMAHRLREAMTDPAFIKKMGGGGQIVEADETFWGGIKGRKVKTGGGHKMKVMSLVERGGKSRSIVITDLKTPTISKVLNDHVEPDTRLMTDEAGHYTPAGRGFLSHSVVKHSAGEYVRGIAHTNTVEGFFSLLKRGLIGTFHHVGEQHLQRYVNEFDFRYSNRKTSDAERADVALKGIKGKRLTYKGTRQQQVAV